MSTLIPSGARTKVIFIILPDNVHNITPLSELVTGMTIILNVTLRLGVNKTVITRQPALSHSMSMNLVRVTGLSIKDVRPIMTGLVRKQVLPSLVLPIRNSKRIRVVVLMILLMEHVASRPVVRLIPH